MADGQTTLEAFYKGWENYQAQLITAIAPLSEDQLALRVAPHLRSVGELATHIVGARAAWFHRGISEGTAETEGILKWRDEDAHQPTAAELVDGLNATWRMMRDALARWTPEEIASPFERERNGQMRTLTRQWVIWHLLEHDLHHGGELSYSLGVHGVQALDI